ncbi:hypothetical protein GCM10007989_33710 [Devosia pacifica]|uniref:Uncharacterized protein n=1 Tax=Devosia pacifica TaxID=1335967 RepID=A0A918VW27_9HYPH|nr:hypothetical protein [Devosia pacifica]GHA35045.1 hypothetical protein GCM10007989_33710 [Devosia pacifica]
MMEKFDNYLVTKVIGVGVIPVSFVPETTEALPGTYRVDMLANATLVTSSDGDDLPFFAFRFIRDGHVPVTFYSTCRDDGVAGYLINDAPEREVTINDLDDADRAYIRGERA